jgi:hypothetical protein
VEDGAMMVVDHPIPFFIWVPDKAPNPLDEPRTSLILITEKPTGVSKTLRYKGTGCGAHL